MVALHEDSAHTSVGCDICDSGDPTVNRCTTCCIFLCEFCSQAHLRARDTSSHDIVSVEEAKKMGSVAMAKPSLCKEHKGEVMKLFCATCDKVICRDCTVVEHRNHEYTFVKEAYSTEKERLLDILSETKTRIPMLEEALQSVSEMKTRVECHAQKTVQDAIKCRDELVDCANIRHKQLIQLIEELRMVKLKGLQVQEEELETALTSVKNGVEFTEKALKNSSEVDILNMRKLMSSRLEGFNSANWHLKPCTEEVVQLNVDMQQLKQAMKNFGTITEGQASAGMSTVTMDNGPEGVMCNTLCGEQITFTITSKEQNGRKRRNGGDIFEAEICCSEDSSTEWLKVKDCEDGTYIFAYTPQQVGQYELSVKLSDCHVQGSPFKWKVEDLYTWYGASTLTMGNGEEAVMYNTLCGQPVEFTINTKEQKQANKKLSSRQDIFKVEIYSSWLFLKRLPVKDKGNGSYSFCYTPISEGSYRLLITVQNLQIKGCPFVWTVEKWTLTAPAHSSRSWNSLLNLIDENMRAHYIQSIPFGGSNVLTAFGSVGFSEGKHSWKVRMSKGGTSEEFGFGVASSAVQRGSSAASQSTQLRWLWTLSSRENTYFAGQKISPFKNNDVIELYLDCDKGTLAMYNQRIKMSFSRQGVLGQVYAVFQMCTNGDEVSLRP